MIQKISQLQNGQQKNEQLCVCVTWFTNVLFVKNAFVPLRLWSSSSSASSSKDPYHHYDHYNHCNTTTIVINIISNTVVMVINLLSSTSSL